MIIFPQWFTSSLCLCLAKLWGSPSSSSEMPRNELHCSLQRTTWSEKHGFLKGWCFSLCNLSLGEDLTDSLQAGMSWNPLHCLCDRRLICIWWHPCWFPENVCVMLKGCLPSITTIFLIEKTWQNCDLKWFYLFISSSLMYAIVSQTYLTIRITVLGEKWRFLGSSSGDTDPLGLGCSQKPPFSKCPRWVWSSRFGTHWNVTLSLISSLPHQHCYR